MQKYFNFIDIGRFIAALSVLGFHYFAVTYNSISPNNADIVKQIFKTYMSHGYMGVQLFFIISGFVIYITLTDDVKSFLKSRFLRLYPMFWIACTLTFIVSLTLGDKLILDGNINTQYIMMYLKNLIIINSGKTETMIDGSYWTLTYEIIFYFMAGTFVLFFKKKNFNKFLYIWLAIISSLVFLNMEDYFISKLLLVRAGYYFIFGALTAYLIHNWKTINIKQKTLNLFALFFSIYMTLNLGEKLNSSNVISNTFGKYNTFEQYLIVLVFIIFLAFVYLSIKFKDNLKINNIAKVAGGVTYPLYLTHHEIGAIVLGGLGLWGLLNLQTLGFALIMLVLSFTLYRIDKRIVAKIKEII